MASIPHPMTVARVCPRPYTSYAKIFHAIFEDPEFVDGELTWEEVEGTADERWWRDIVGTEPPGVLARSGTEELDLGKVRRVLWRDIVAPDLLDSRANWRTLGMSFAGPSLPRRVVGPDEGTLDLISLVALVGNLQSRSLRTSCIMFMEEWAALLLGADHDVAPGVGLVATGHVRDAERFVGRFGATPQCWWATDESWWVFTDHDSCVTFVAGPDDLTREIHADPRLESIPVHGEDVAFPDRRWSDDAGQRHGPEPGGSADGLDLFLVSKAAFYRGVLWLVASWAVIAVTMLIARENPAGPVAMAVWVPAMVYGVYRFTRGVYESAGPVRPLGNGRSRRPPESS